MASTPISQRHKKDSRQAVWNIVRQLRTDFTIADIAAKTKMAADTIRDYLNGLEKAEYLKGVPGQAIGTAKRYSLIKDAGFDAPRVKRDGKPCKRGAGNEQMWRTMRILKTFTCAELAVNASTTKHQVKESTAVDYCGDLLKAGYLRVVSGHGPVAVTYRLIRNTGPKPPIVQRIKQIYDQNQQKVVWTEEAAHE